MATSIGEMRSVVKVMQNQPTENASGGTDDNFIVMLTTRGKLTRNSGRKDIEAGNVQFDKSFKLQIRFQIGLVINKDLRMNIDGTDYMIVDWYLDEEIKHWYNFILNRVDE